MAGPLLGMMQQMGGMMVGQQIGQALGALALEVVGSTDIGLPLPDIAALLPGRHRRVQRGPGDPAEEIRLYLALREAAHHRLFQHVPWLRPQLLGAVEEYAGASPSTVQDGGAAPRIDLNNPERCSRRSAASCSSRRRRRSRRPRWPGWRPCSPWSRAGWTPS